MTNTVYFDPAVGGTGLTVTDDGNPTTGLDNDGHRERLIPAFSNVVQIAQHVVDTAEDVAAVAPLLQPAIDAAATATAAATAASDSADEAEYWAGQAGATVTGGVKVSGTDTTAKPLSDKIQLLGGTSTILNQDGDEVLRLEIGASSIINHQFLLAQGVA